MYWLENLKEYRWTDAIAKAACPKCHQHLKWVATYPSGELELIVLNAECCGYNWKFIPSMGFVESNYASYSA